jgi:hypothetical protein
MNEVAKAVGWVERTRETHRTVARHPVGLMSTFDPPYGISRSAPSAITSKT